MVPSSGTLLFVFCNYTIQYMYFQFQWHFYCEYLYAPNFFSNQNLCKISVMVPCCKRAYDLKKHKAIAAWKDGAEAVALILFPLNMKEQPFQQYVPNLFEDTPIPRFHLLISSSPNKATSFLFCGQVYEDPCTKYCIRSLLLCTPVCGIASVVVFSQLQRKHGRTCKAHTGVSLKLMSLAAVLKTWNQWLG